VVFDVGANVGWLTNHYRELIPNARIVAFEPTPSLAGGLRQRFADDPGITVAEIAVSDKPGLTTFHVNNLHATSSLFPRNKGKRYFPAESKEVEQITVRTNTLDNYAAEHGIDRIDILKMDIQGSEVLALKGAERLLREKRIDMIASEMFFVPHYEGAATALAQMSFLDGLGYSLFHLDDLIIAPNGQLRYADGLFVSPLARTRIESE
jgi:FkbM family methyltransferase